MVGSFLNVLIYRLPLEQNFVFPRSACPHCSKLIPWYENIPLFSFIFLKGKCSGCAQRISFRYPCIELLIGLGALYICDDSIMSAHGAWLILVKFVVLCILVVHFFIDWEYQILPDSLNLVLGVLLLSYAVFNFTWSYWLFGGLVGAGFPFLVTWGFYLVKGQIGLGGGDIKLFGVLGFFLGPLGIIHTIFLSCFVGALVGGTAILLGKMTKEKPIAFGPFIIVIAALQIYFPNFVAHYLIFI